MNATLQVKRREGDYGFLDRLFRRKETQPDGEAEVPEPVCPHAALTPHWDIAAEMGKTESVSSYTCESCGASFTRAEGERLLSEAAERLRISDEQRL